MTQITQIIEGTVRVDATAVLANGASHTTSVAYPSVSNLRQQDVTERREKAAEQIAAELQAATAERSQQVSECTELMQQIEAETAGIAAAREHTYWPILTQRGEIAAEAALKRALSPTVSDDTRELWFALAAEAAMVDLPNHDGTVGDRIIAWQEWASQNGIAL